MNRVLNNPLCRCGHLYNVHKENYTFPVPDGFLPVPARFYDVCLVSDDSDVYHECVFKMDNLKFMEQCYDNL